MFDFFTDFDELNKTNDKDKAPENPNGATSLESDSSALEINELKDTIKLLREQTSQLATQLKQLQGDDKPNDN